MSIDEFWYEDEELFECYTKAYNNDVNQKAWLNGIYTLRAVESAINNVMPAAVSIGMGGGKVKPIHYYDEPIDLYENKSEDVKQQNETRDEEFARRMNMFP